MRRFALLILVITIAAVASGCTSTNTEPTQSQLDRSAGACAKLKHARFFPECYHITSDGLRPLTEHIDGEPAANVKRVWDRQESQTVALIDDYESKPFNYDRLEQAVRCQSKGKKAKRMATCWARNGKQWFLLTRGSSANATADKPNKTVRKQWSDYCGGNYCTEDEYSSNKDDDDTVIIPNPNGDGTVIIM
jgi:hypothetical protein